MQIPLLSGITVDAVARLRTSYPRNLVPTPKDNGISKGYMRQPEGLTQFASGPGPDRGGIAWNGLLYRVMGSKLVVISDQGAINIIGDVGGATDSVWMAYSFDRLAVLSNEALYYYNGTTLTQVTDPDLGTPKTLIWVDGYFMLTDTQTVKVTSLADPTSILPFAFDGNQFDPDGIQCVVKVQDQPYIVGKTNIFVYQNVGGQFFPFQVIAGSNIFKGAIGPNCACEFNNQVAFLGNGPNEPPAVYMATSGQYTKISTAEIDTILLDYGDALKNAIVETRLDKNHSFLYIHLPNRTLVYDFASSQVMQQPVWFSLDSGLAVFSQYRARKFTWCYNKWLFGDMTTNNIGFLDSAQSKHFGQDVWWQFDTVVLYNAGKSGIVHELELIGITGNVSIGDDPQIATCYSLDGKMFSTMRWRSAGKIGQSGKRLNWLHNGSIHKFRIQRFIGTAKAHVSLMALEATIEPLKV